MLKLLRSIPRADAGIISIEVALILPVILMIGLSVYDASALSKTKSRANQAFFALGDTVSSSPGNLTCDILDTIAELSYDAYSTGNWGRNNEYFRAYGARDYRFDIRGLRVQSLSDPDVNPNNLKAEVEWSFHRRHWVIGRAGGSNPGTLVSIPAELRFPGEFLISVRGYNLAQPKLNFMGMFGRQRTKTTTLYFVPRHTDQILLDGADTYSSRCSSAPRP